MLAANDIARLHEECTRRWHTVPPRFEGGPSDFQSAVEQQHFANFELWHEEDKARMPGASDHEIATVKRNIDRFNQRRNDLMEKCDFFALEELKPRQLPNASAPLHSESVGLMIDRLSILSLKIFHTEQEIERANAPTGHGERNRERLAILQEQRNDLAGAFDSLWQEILAGKKRFKIYRQLKMYNEPSLNPLIYEARKR
ncbi:MAG TPA: DUF4254 domain-containing protein [Candidatus Koribacter sp.]|jgi:hypothetical protein